MTPLTTEDFPYTISYVMELLKVEERELMSYVQAIGLSPVRDERSDKPVFTHRDLETLRKAIEMRRQGDDLSVIAQRLGRRDTLQRPVQNFPHATQQQGVATQALSQSGLNNNENLTVMVEAVSQVKEGILKDLSRLLDDKLSGLDEVVVELIRCKSENDTLKQRLAETLKAKEDLEHELSLFKPVQFGFYRKG